MPTYFLETFGCQMNVSDSNAISELLEDRGLTRADGAKDADLLVVNTCSVREHAEQRALQRLRQYSVAKNRRGNRQRLWVVGCMAQRLGDSLRDMVPGIDAIIGARDLPALGNSIDAMLGHNMAIATDTTSLSHTGVSAFVPVMRGCNNYCAYCIVPYVRGPEVSVPSRDIISTVQDLTRQNVKEVTLLGQNVNSYCDDTIDFAALLEEVHEKTTINRIRFTTSHPKDLSDRLIAAIATLPRVCKHLHLPVQSGSTRVLKAMNRCYTREQYLERIAAVRSACPTIDLTTDAMVGFPGETSLEFEETLSLFDSVRYTMAFMFAYSQRAGTAAASLPDDVDAKEKSRRLSLLIDHQTAQSRKIYSATVGTIVEGLFTQKQERKDRAWMGQDNGCKNLLLSCDRDLTGTILPVTILSSTGKTLICGLSPTETLPQPC